MHVTRSAQWTRRSRVRKCTGRVSANPELQTDSVINVRDSTLDSVPTDVKVSLSTQNQMRNLGGYIENWTLDILATQSSQCLFSYK